MTKRKLDEQEEWSAFMGYRVFITHILGIKREVAALLRREGGSGSELSKNYNHKRRED